MNSQARSTFKSIFDEDWIKLGYKQEDEPGLTQNIHALFKRTNEKRPQGQEHIWPQYKSEADYDKMFSEINDVLQLASNMLLTPKSLDFLYQVVYSDRKIPVGGPSSNNKGGPCREFGRNESIPSLLTRGSARDALRNLAHSITLKIGDSEVNPAVKGSFAVTQPDISNPLDGVKLNDVSTTVGVRSVITLNETYINTLRELKNEEGDTTSQRMNIQLKMAITLCHEIAHALAYAVDNETRDIFINQYNAYQLAKLEGRVYQVQVSISDEPFYKDETMAEIGYSWENQVFGGNVLWSTKTSDPLFVSKWPNFFTDGDHPNRGKESRAARQYLVPRHFIQNMHRQGFWDNLVRGDTTALYIKKTIGIDYGNPDLEALSINSSEAKYPKLNSVPNRIDRKDNSRLIADPSASHANETEAERNSRDIISSLDFRQMTLME